MASGEARREFMLATGGPAAPSTLALFAQTGDATQMAPGKEIQKDFLAH